MSSSGRGGVGTRLAVCAHMARVFFSVVLLAALASGCARLDPACPECTEPSAELAQIAGRTYLISSVTFPDAHQGQAGGATAVGLDLDGFDSGLGSTAQGPRCDQFAMDYASELGPSFSGVDNAGQSLIRTAEGTVDGGVDFDGALHDAIAHGRIRWAIHIDALPGDAGPATVLGMELWAIDEAVATDIEGVPLPDQTLRAHRIARTEASVNDSVLWGYVTDEVDMEVSGMDVALLPFDDFRLGGWAAVAQTNSGVLAGHLGGSFSVDGLTELSAQLTGREFSEVYRSVYESVADLHPSAEDPFTCERISVGFAFEAVPVELVE